MTEDIHKNQDQEKVIVKCCLCGREKTGEGWQYRSPAEDLYSDILSHGLCGTCYETEATKIDASEVAGWEAVN